MAMVLLAPSASYTPVRCLHGKSDPSAASGLLLSVDLPYGVGVAMIIWAFPVEKSMATRARRAAVVLECIVKIIRAGRSFCGVVVLEEENAFGR